MQLPANVYMNANLPNIVQATKHSHCTGYKKIRKHISRDLPFTYKLKQDTLVIAFVSSLVTA